jgi:polar amino acid transport system substrate-binding protein
MYKLSYFFITILFIITQTIYAKPVEITVGTDSWPPFRIHENPMSSGIDFDLWGEIEKRLNIRIKFKQYPWSRILHNLENGDLDAMSGLAKRAERELYMTYTSKSYFTCSTVFYMKKGEGHLIKKYEDLYKYPIAYVANSAYFSRFDNDEKLKKYSIYTEIQLIKMLANNRIKVIIGTDCQADYHISQFGLTNKFEKAHYRPNNNVDLYIAISKKSPFIKELKEVNKVIDEIIKEGKIKEFSKKYFH